MTRTHIQYFSSSEQIFALMLVFAMSGCAASDGGRSPLAQFGDSYARSAVFVTEHIPYMICFPNEYAENVRVARERERTAENQLDSVRSTDSPLSPGGR